MNHDSPLCDESQEKLLSNYHSSPVFIYRLSRSSKLVIALLALLNVILSTLLILGHPAKCYSGKSSYAGLTRNQPVAWTAYDPFTTPNETEVDHIWEMTDIDSGVVALGDIYAAMKNLPKSQRFPWDDSKGIYLLNVHHNLHCLKLVRRSLKQYREHVPQTELPGHISHCLDTIRQDLICDADDTPRWTGYGDMISGVGQVRQCKDWNTLNAWAKEHTACYKHIPLAESDVDRLKPYTFCPPQSPQSPQSPYIEKIHRFYPNA